MQNLCLAILSAMKSAGNGLSYGRILQKLNKNQLGNASNRYFGTL